MVGHRLVGKNYRRSCISGAESDALLLPPLNSRRVCSGSSSRSVSVNQGAALFFWQNSDGFSPPLIPSPPDGLFHDHAFDDLNC